MFVSNFKKVAIAAFIILSSTSCIANEPHVKLKGKKFTVEIADTPDKQQLGLMFRESMPRDHGMLFIFSGETRRSFWMKNTKIPLDIIYFDKNLELVSVSNAKPCRTPACPNYPSTGPAMYVLELNAGLAEELNLAAGDPLEVHLPDE